MDTDMLNERIRTAMPFAGLLGIDMLAADANEVRARLAWDESRCTAGGALHGGALMGLADTAGGLCAFYNLPDGATATATIESKTNFFRPVSKGHVDSVSRVIHQGRTTIVVETELADAAGRPVAKVTQTQAILRPEG